ncbi:Uncharacterised protein [Candidatus Bilamarchaeum dharawalense]|uniref:Uncharacterized protein n=1 Tax=Candidatus Bilamarchaeum dharawalense TaxID=2885759 RepID=A0A5E4LKT2_9ARCH|nr:Uncharacterised protein [Candidatus Bilamarchaeum dharawalense]
MAFKEDKVDLKAARDALEAAIRSPLPQGATVQANPTLSIDGAKGALKDLSGFGARVVLPAIENPAVRIAASPSENDQKILPGSFLAASKAMVYANPKPAQFFQNPDEAKQRLAELEGQLSQDQKIVEGSKLKPDANVLVIDAWKIFDPEKIGPLRKPDLSSILSGRFFFSKSPEAIMTDVVGWVDDSYKAHSGQVSPPVLIVQPTTFFGTYNDTYNTSSIGFYDPKSNLIVISESLAGFNQADQYHVLTHEYLHYLSSCSGGGFQFKVIPEGESTPKFYSSRLFHEGLTELHAQEITRAHGVKPSSVAYSPDVVAAAYIQHVVGPEILKEAYLTGDFTKVAIAFDKAIGRPGSFNEFMEIYTKPVGEGGGAKVAIAFLDTLFQAEGVSTRALDSNPIVIDGRKVIRALEREAR